MQSVEEFLAYAIKLEEEAAIRFGQLADAMELAVLVRSESFSANSRPTPNFIMRMRWPVPASVPCQRSGQVNFPGPISRALKRLRFGQPIP